MISAKNRERVIKNNEFTIRFLKNNITYTHSTKKRIVYSENYNDLRNQIIYFLEDKKINENILKLIVDLSYKIYGI